MLGVSRDPSEVWIQRMRSAGLEPGLSASPSRRTRGARSDRTRAAGGGRPAAIVYTSDLLALAGVGVARELGLDVPGDVSIAGFDDSPVAALSSPSPTTVRVDYGGFGETAAALLLAEIEGTPAPRFQHAEPEVAVRDSSAPAPIRPIAA